MNWLFSNLNGFTSISRIILSKNNWCHREPLKLLARILNLLWFQIWVLFYKSSFRFESNSLELKNVLANISRTLNSSDSLARTKNGSENGTEKKVQWVNFFLESSPSLIMSSISRYYYRKQELIGASCFKSNKYCSYEYRDMLI